MAALMSNKTTSAIAIFLLLCMIISLGMTILFIKWECDRRTILRRLRNCGISISGRVIKHSLRRSKEGIVASQLRRLSVSSSWVDPDSGLVGVRRGRSSKKVGAEYSTKNTKGDGQITTYFAEFENEVLYDAVIEGGAIQLMVHPDNPKIVRPVIAEEMAIGCFGNSTVQGNFGTVSVLNVGMLTLVSLASFICFLVAYLLIFRGSNPLLSFNSKRPVPWIIFALVIILSLVYTIPKLYSFEATEVDFENANEVVKEKTKSSEVPNAPGK